ncbi:sugar ABC transporter substrate-binding protein [Streptomyces boninensis]|uniref:sugar ABC transporter substrate-binding protein n=1 Tax=Streptomyces boninensis TaxID=2039455 RepID=UPI003B20C0CE
MPPRRARWPALALLAPLVLSGCGGNNGVPDDAGTLRVMDYYVDEPHRSIYDRTLKECGRRAGVAIEHESVPNASLIPKTLQQAASRTLPDLLMIDNPDIQQIAATGALHPVTELGLSARGYARSVVAAASHRGKVYALQPVANTIGLFYDKDALAQAGIDPPTTWTELKTAAKKLTEGSRYGIAFSAAATYEGTWQFLPFMWSNGGDERRLTSPRNAAALRLWSDLVREGSASRSVVNWGQTDVSDQFAAGKAAMMVNGPWQLPALDEKKDRHYGIARIPVPKAGDRSVVPLGGEGWTLPRTGNAEREAKAAKVLGCLTSDDNQLALAAKRQTVPTKTALMGPFARKHPEMREFTELVRGSRARTGALGEDWPDAATKIYTALQTALARGASPQQALREAAHD